MMQRVRRDQVADLAERIDRARLRLSLGRTGEQTNRPPPDKRIKVMRVG